MNSKVLGIAPLTDKDLHRTKKNMEAKGLYTKKDTETVKNIKALKLLVKFWMKRELQLTKEEWTSLEIIEMTQSTKTDGDIVYISTLSSSTQTNAPRLVNYIPKECWKRYNDTQLIAFNIRNNPKNLVQKQTTIFQGKYDYLLRVKDKGSGIPWSQIPPVKITNTISDFEIEYYKKTGQTNNRTKNKPNTNHNFQYKNEMDQEEERLKRVRSTESQDMEIQSKQHRTTDGYKQQMEIETDENTTTEDKQIKTQKKNK